jgi:thiol-disulfide isomerase/thioredoxin
MIYYFHMKGLTPKKRRWKRGISLLLGFVCLNFCTSTSEAEIEEGSAEPFLQEEAVRNEKPGCPEISAAELEEFGATVYQEYELFPLEGLVTLDGKPYDQSALKGKSAFINLWASWCPYCGKEKPSIQRLYEERGKLEILTIALGESVETVGAYMAENGYTFPVVVNESNSLKAQYAPRIPKSYIIDGAGRIAARIDGNKEWTEEIARRIVSYLTGMK